MTSSVDSLSNNSTYIRPRLIFLSTEDVRNYEDASSVRVSLRDQIFAQDGFKLSYGVKSFGYNTNVMNISSVQNNNSITLEVTYLLAQYVYDPGENEIYTGKFVPNPKVPEGSLGTYEKKLIEIILPDDNYDTVDKLFQTLTDYIRLAVPSGWYFDRTKPNSGVYYEIGFPLKFESFVNGFAIDIDSQSSIQVKQAYELVTDVGLQYFSAWQVNDKISEITIVPTQNKPGLFNLLFTNTKSSIPNKPVCLPSFSIQSGMNPPKGISFIIDTTTYATYIPPGGSATIYSSTELIDVILLLKYQLKELGNENLLDTTASPAKYPNEIIYRRDNLPYFSYFTPDIHPIYLDVQSNLENLNMTQEGYQRNLLLRQFIVGASSGTSSFYQQWDTPVTYIVDAPSISSFELKFSSQGDKWNFFNLEFTMEVLIFEIVDEKSQPDFIEPTFQMPGEDALTSFLQQTQRSGNNPYPILGSGQKRVLVEKDDILNRRAKRKMDRK